MSLVDGRTLISAHQLDEALGDPALRIFDCTVHLRPDPKRTYRIESGRADWQAERLPRAGFLDLTADLSDADSAFGFTLPEPESLRAALAANGVVDGARIVLYASNHPMWATRVWWMLRSMSVDAAVLDGGLGAWKAAGLPTESGPFSHPAGTLSCTFRPEDWADQARVLAHIADGGTCTINALSPSMYRGDAGHSYGRPGHITGSVNLPYASLYQPDTLEYLDAGELRRHFDAVDAFNKAVICYCGGGISATCDAFALVNLGHEDVRVYDGSMSEWVSNPELPMTVGESPA